VTKTLLLDNSAWVRLSTLDDARAAGIALGVLHYDHDYDLISERTDLSYESVWVAPRGSI